MQLDDLNAREHRSKQNSPSCSTFMQRMRMLSMNKGMTYRVSGSNSIFERCGSTFSTPFPIGGSVMRSHANDVVSKKSIGRTRWTMRRSVTKLTIQGMVPLKLSFTSNSSIFLGGLYHRAIRLVLDVAAFPHFLVVFLLWFRIWEQWCGILIVFDVDQLVGFNLHEYL